MAENSPGELPPEEQKIEYEKGVAEKNHLLVDINKDYQHFDSIGENPINLWHLDGTPEFYQEMLEDFVLMPIREIGRNPDAKEFQKRVIENVQKHLAWAKKDILKKHPLLPEEELLALEEYSKNHLTSYDSIKRAESFCRVIDEVYEKLEEFKN